MFYAGTVTNDKGAAEEWVFEGHSISGLVRQGWSANLIKVGDEVQVMVNRHRDPSQHFALLDRVDAGRRQDVLLHRCPSCGSGGEAPTDPAIEGFSGNWRYRLPARRKKCAVGCYWVPAAPVQDLPYTAAAKAQAAKYDENKAPALTCEPISVPAILMTVVRVQVDPPLRPHRHRERAVHGHDPDDLAEPGDAAGGLQAESDGVLCGALRGRRYARRGDHAVQPGAMGQSPGCRLQRQEKDRRAIQAHRWRYGDEPELHAGGSGVLHRAGDCERHVYQVL